MPITAKCDSCNAQFKVKDAMAGKKVKCPKCQQPFQIPKPNAAPKPSVAKTQQQSAPAAADEYSLAPPVPAAPRHNPMLDLLEKAGVESTPRGPVCPECGAEISPTAVVCVECGYNLETGQQLETHAIDDGGGIAEAGMSDAEKMIARAEQEIDESPVSSSEQDFGDGADSIFLAIVCVVVAVVLTGLGVGTIFVMDAIGEQINTALISMFGSIAIYLFCAIWITIVAFRAKPIHGVACLFTGGVYCIIFGFMMGRTLLLPTLICIAGLAIGGISYAVAASQNAQLLESATQFVDIVTIV